MRMHTEYSIYIVEAVDVEKLNLFLPGLYPGNPVAYIVWLESALGN